MAINLPNGLLQLLGIEPSTIEISLGNGGDSFNGTNANEHIQGNGGGDSINAGGGSDIVEGGAGADLLNGQDGNDYVEGGIGGDAMNGGSGSDTLGYSQSGSSVRVTLNDAGGGTTSGSGSGPGNHAQGDSISGFENVVGSNFGDTLTGNIHRNVLAGLAGADKLYGMAGDDILVGGIGADVLDGGSGIDTADYSTSAAPVHLVLGGVSTGGDAQGDTLISIEKLVGTAGADVFDGSSSLTGFSADGGGGADTMLGGHGDDTLSIGGAAAAVAGFAALQEGEGGTLEGGEGDDELVGGDGDDLIFGDAGNDTLFGLGGHDQIVGGVDNDALIGGEGDDTLFGESGDDRLFGEGGSDTLVGGDGTDTLDGESGDDVLFGEGGIDTLEGGDGDDTLEGGDGNDTLAGGDGVDKLFAGLGVEDGMESLVGGAGADFFGFRSVEELPQFQKVILDFSPMENDRILLGEIDALTSSPEDNAFTWIGKQVPLAEGQLGFQEGEGDIELFNVIFGYVGAEGGAFTFLVNKSAGEPDESFFFL
ncbi:calcium-binding protein [Phyllobacterium endophyticum]|uniref:calcium-binding protein n=1 Tax=Phyllobacterium endophyticum TaxID=1149773 RepID=UPI0011CC4566|nr:calcium-binding protein [Phyllobacterium endophyticum]TXR47558.1 calcium-binding protein [Phyllobacterium endophyticum]